MENKESVASRAGDLDCDICFVEYDAQYRVPKMLKCGHTFCDVCIKDLLHKSPKCPTCRAPITENETIKNFALLKFIPNSNPKNKNRHYEDTKTELECFKKELASQREISVKYRDMHDDDIRTIDTSLCQIDELLEAKVEDLDRDSSLHIINEVKKTLQSFKKDKKPVPKLFATPLSDFREYILKIYRRTESEGKLLSVHQPNYESNLVYGKISNWSNALCFHCLQLSDPEDCQDFLKFDDLKKVTSSVKLKLFLKIPCKTQVNKIVMIEPFCSSLLPQFIRLCTGEMGVSYREASFTKGEDIDRYSKSILKVTRYRIENKSGNDVGSVEYDKNKIDYAFGSNIERVFKEPKTVVVAFPDGGFQIFYNYNKAFYKNVVGVVETQTNLQDIISFQEEKEQRILDCGIAFEL